MNLPCLEIVWERQIDAHVLAASTLHRLPLIAALPTDGPVHLLNLETGSTIGTLPSHPSGNASLEIHPVDDSIMTGGHDGILLRHTPPFHREPQCINAGDRWIEPIRASPDGKWIAHGSGRTLTIRNTTQEVSAVLTNQTSTIADIQWRNDSRALAFSTYGQLTLIRQGQSNSWETYPYANLIWKGSLQQIAWSPSGRYIAATTSERSVKLWRTPFEQSGEMVMHGYDTNVTQLRWTPDSRFLLTSGSEVLTSWDTSGRGPSGTTPERRAGHQSAITAIAVSTDGKIILSGDGDGLILAGTVSVPQCRLSHSNADPVSTLQPTHKNRHFIAGYNSGKIQLIRVP